MAATALARPRAPMVRLYADEACVDLFAGGGGTSTGIEMILGRSPDVAINHNEEALAMHKVNHPNTLHLREDVCDVDPRKVKVLKGKKLGFIWLSPDCTFHSKARGGKPFRDRHRARRIRGLIGVALRWASQKNKPRIIFVENVEEIEFWCPLGKDGRPDPKKRGASFRRWVSRLRNLGYNVEWRQLRACDFGAPTTRKRLFIVARCDGKPIVWPEPTHGKHATTRSRYRTAADNIDFSLPVPSIFMTPKEAKAWGKAHGVAAPKRPLAVATQRRIARGVVRYVLNSANPFIIPVTHPRDARVHDIHEPLRTITASERGEFAMVTPFLAKYHGKRRRADENQRVLPMDEPIATLDTSNRFALIAPTLIQTSYGERKGQKPRTLNIHAPLGTIMAGGIKHSVVTAFLAKHNAGHEATGQHLEKPIDTVTTRDSKALVTSHLVKLRGGVDTHPNTAQDVREPVGTITAGGTHIAEVRAFLLKFYGTKKDGCDITKPIDTVTTKERFGLITVTIAGEDYVLVDIGMRMLTPRELFRCQGFPVDYQIERGIHPVKNTPVVLTKKAQTRMVGNSVPPHVAAALIAANLGRKNLGQELVA